MPGWSTIVQERSAHVPQAAGDTGSLKRRALAGPRATRRPDAVAEARGRFRPALALALLFLAAALGLALAGCSADGPEEGSLRTLDAADLPAYAGEPATVVEGNQPCFSSKERSQPFGTEQYGRLDSLGRCTVAFAVVGPETTPTEEREYIGNVRPAGWHLAPYSFIDGRYLYNRCHLLGFQLTGENANERNLITGTRYLNVQGMLPYENQVADYVERTGNHVLMRVTPLFQGSNLIPSGVQMEAESVEDEGTGVRFNVYCHNVQPGIHIEYDDGSNWVDEEGAKMQAAAEAASSDREADEGTVAPSSSDEVSKEPRDGVTFVLNINTERFHKPECRSVSTMKPKNTRYFYGTRERAVELGFQPCGNCHP